MASPQDIVAAVKDGAKHEPITDAGDQADVEKDIAVRIFRSTVITGKLSQASYIVS